MISNNSIDLDIKMETVKHISGIIILTFLIGTFYITDRIPFSDENVYFRHAYSIYSHSTFGIVDKKTGYSEPGARVAPLYPAMLAGIMLADKDFAGSAECHLASLGAEERNCLATI